MLKSSTNKMISFCKSRGKQSCDMARKKCALVACVRVCAQNISREEWFSVPSRTGHPPAYQQKYCPSLQIKDVGLIVKIMLSVHLPINENVIHLPAYQQKNVGLHFKINVTALPTYQQKYCPSRGKSKDVGLHFKIIVCVSLKNVIRPPTYQPTKKSKDVGLHFKINVCVSLKNVIRLPTYQQKNVMLGYISK